MRSSLPVWTSSAPLVPGEAGSGEADVSPEVIPNVLATRYASAEMTEVWSPRHKVILERRLWIAVLEAQREAGVGVPDGALEAYRDVVTQVDLDSITERERITRHDVKARIEEFCALAGYEQIHRAMTSRDVTENVEQCQVAAALGLVAQRIAAFVVRIAALATAHRDLVMAARTHNVPAQATTLGKRWATIGTEALVSLERIEELLARYPLRGIRGPVGTQQDMLELLGDDRAAVDRLERRLAAELGFVRVLGSAGQIYPRSLDLDVVAVLVGAAAPLGNLALSVRLAAGHELVTEGFTAGQVGSSAMPHKMNTRSCERITGLVTILRGHLMMASQLAGDQWDEGDVSCSVVRRIVLPDAFFALDGALETAFSVLDGFAVFPARVEAELAAYLPFLATTRLLAAAVAAGAGREEAHERIGAHATAAVLALREGTVDRNDLAARIAADPELQLSDNDVAAALADPASFSGRAADQVDEFVAAAGKVAERYGAAVDYEPGEVL
ncbi:MAG: adenylosuccinate lyase [Acidimicrobiales bacterium]|nr:adenylosuccinate lyase [Acidimicrobiales bacterium]MYJ47838.1 adenylosuccinate lyase [Acidimicrobiales bacterium]